MMQARNVELPLWAEAVNTAVYLLNRVSSNGNDDSKTSYEVWMDKKPDIKHVRAFGEEGFEHVPKQFTQKFDAKAKKVLLVGYEGNSSNYRLFHPDTRKVTVSKNVIFHEAIGTKEVPEEVKEQEEEELKLSVKKQEVPNEQQTPNEQQVKEAQARGKAKTILAIESRMLRDRTLIHAPLRYETNFVEFNVPTNYEEALSGPDASQWTKAVEEELKAHEKNHTWQLIPRDHKRKTIDSKWVFKIIRGEDGSALRYKARLCARGFLQEKGVDFTETFSPVVRYDSLRVLLATVTQEDLEMVQFDVRTAFLYGKLEDEVLMEVPTGFKIVTDSSEVVCRLEKSLYGLKQASLCWNHRFCDFLRQFKFKQTDADECIFYSNYQGLAVYLALYVDDGLIACKSQEVLEIILEKLMNTFEITLGDCSFAGLQLVRNRATKSMFIHQSNYTRKILEKFHMDKAKAVSVPADPNIILQPLEPDKTKLCNVPYREAVGSLMFLSIVSRPDIAYAVNVVSRFLNNHGDDHWRAVKRIFAFLVGTKDIGIMYQSGGSKPDLIGYSDADYASDLETRRSTTGYIFSLANGPVTWASQRQKLVVLSTTEAEYVAASTAAKEIIWLRKLMNGIGRCSQATILYVDNQSTIRLAKNREFHKRTKHIDIRYYHLRETSEANIIHVEYIPSENQQADILTKALPKERFLNHCENIGLSER